MTIKGEIEHHGATDGVTGSCHQLWIDGSNSILIDCGLFQGDEGQDGESGSKLAIEFPVETIRALVVTHLHIDHTGRIPYLLAAGFQGPIYCSRPTARLLPLVLEDALKVGVTRNRRLIEQFLQLLKRLIVALPYREWHTLKLNGTAAAIRLQPAGHIIGSAYVEVNIGPTLRGERIVFSGDLGAPWTPLLCSPKSPGRADKLVLESTYGERRHEQRRTRQRRLKGVIKRAFVNGGTLLIPAFSIGRTQELLYEIEGLIHRNPVWQDLEIVVDSPLANRFTEHYRQLKPYWDAEAKRRLRAGRHPLSFEQLTTIEGHREHLQTVDYLAKRERPAIVIAASGMCSGGRIVNYLKAMIGDPKHDIAFVGYQARGTPGRVIQNYGPKGGYVELDGERHTIRVGVHTLAGYSAHADQRDLLKFIKRMRRRPSEVRLVHGDNHAKATLKRAIEAMDLGIQVEIP